MVRAWIADVRPLYEEQNYKAYYMNLPDFRRDKADALRNPEHKAQSVGVWALWQRICREYGLGEDTRVNFSHSGRYVMCAAFLNGKQGRVGCDIQKMGTFSERLAKKFLCPEEYERFMEEATEEGRAELFFRYWTLKESFMKATGKGMGLRPDSFCVRLGTPPVLIRQPKQFRESYYYTEYSVEQIPCKIAVCSSDKEIDARLYMEFKL